MGATNLSSNEGLVLYGLVRYPSMNDRLLSERLGLKMSTLTAIKNRLKRGRYFRTVRIPDMRRLGCEMLTVVFGNLAPLTRMDKLYKVRRLLSQTPLATVSAMLESNLFLLLSISRDYTHAKESVDQLTKELSKEGLLDDQGLTTLHFPFALATVINYFDASPILGYTLEIDPIDGPSHRMAEGMPPREVLFSRSDPMTLTPTESKILYGLVRYPDLPDNRIGKALHVTRQAVAKTKKRLEAEHFLLTRRIPDLRKLGFEILSFVPLYYSPRTSVAERMAQFSQIQGRLMDTFLVTQDMEGVLMVASRDFEEFRRTKNESITAYKKAGLFSRDPEMHLLSIANLQVLRSHDYAYLVARELGLDEGKVVLEPPDPESDADDGWQIDVDA